MNRNYVVGNWKMQIGVSQSKELANGLKSKASNLKNTEVWVAPSHTSLSVVHETLSGTSIKIGSQNVHWEESGAFTGELSPAMLKEVGCSFSLTGHSERRHVFNESSDLVAQRTKGAIVHGLTVIACVGETLEERESNRTEAVVESQLKPIYDALDSSDYNSLLIAYEPVWAIGTGKVASIEEIDSVHNFIANNWKKNTNSECPAILYGGSVNPTNFAEIIEVPLVSGALVGGASLDADKFFALVEISENTN